MTTPTEQLREQLREITAPLAQQLSEVNERISAAQSELDELRGMRRELEAVLGRLNGTHGKPGPKQQKTYKVGPATQHEMNAVHAFMVEQPDRDYTITQTTQWYKAAGRSPAMGRDKMQRVFEQMHERGVIRADRRVKGGGTAYRLVGR